MSKVKLSVYLIKEGFENADVFKHPIQPLGNDFICIKDTYENVPKDVKKFLSTKYPEILDKLKTKYMAAAVLKEVEIGENLKRKFVITFGFGWSLIKEECIEKNFGLRTVLNCAEQSSIKRITKKSISKNSKTSTEQIPFESTLFDFDFDGNGDILTDVTATIKEPYNCKITGKDSVQLNESYVVDNVEELILILYEEYNKIKYKENFPFIDNIQLERDKKVIKALDEIVLDKLKNEKYEDVFTAIPEIVEWDRFDRIEFDYRENKANEKEASEGRDDIKIQDFFTNFDKNKFDNIFKAKIGLYKDDNIYKEFNFKKCLLGEFEYKNACYCIVNASYYRIDRDYKKQIENEYKNLATTSVSYLVDCDYKENEYIAKLTQGNFVKLDCKLVEKSYKIEICDILEKDRIIHLKKYSGATSMSHFCKQATNSALLLKNDKKFIAEANEIIKREIAKTSFLNANDYIFDANFNSNKYNIVFGIISNNGDAKPNISFFSKLNFVQTFKYLENIGFKCQIAGIKDLYEKSSKDKV